MHTLRRYGQRSSSNPIEKINYKKSLLISAIIYSKSHRIVFERIYYNVHPICDIMFSKATPPKSQNKKGQKKEHRTTVKLSQLRNHRNFRPIGYRPKIYALTRSCMHSTLSECRLAYEARIFGLHFCHEAC